MKFVLMTMMSQKNEIPKQWILCNILECVGGYVCTASGGSRPPQGSQVIKQFCSIQETCLTTSYLGNRRELDGGGTTGSCRLGSVGTARRRLAKCSCFSPRCMLTRTHRVQFGPLGWSCIQNVERTM
eukprot:3272348-Pleurochrysis_carterae.AAC.4